MAVIVFCSSPDRPQSSRSAIERRSRGRSIDTAAGSTVALAGAVIGRDVGPSDAEATRRLFQ